MTNNLVRRVSLHKELLIDGFTKQYGVTTLVCYEVYQDVLQAIQREKQLKKWKREWKIELIEKDNPQWEDLYPDLL